MFLVGAAGAVTVVVNVYERDGNVTPVPGASLYANGAFIGKSDAGGSIQFSHPGEAPVGVTVKKLGYATWTGEIDPNTTALSVEMTRAKVALTVEAYDTDTLLPVPAARVKVSGPGVSNATTTDVNGSATVLLESNAVYTVEVEAPGFRLYERAIEVGFEEKNLQVLLVREERFSVTVRDAATGEPVPGARVSVDGAERGVTDPRGALFLSLPRGKVYAIAVTKEGYEEYRSQQIVGEDQAIVPVSLSKSTAVVFVNVYGEGRNPLEGAMVTVDGKPAGSTNKYGRLQVPNLTYGTYTLNVTAPGHVPVSRSLAVSSRTEDVHVELPRARVNVTLVATEGESGRVAGATVLVNGTPAGTTGPEGTLELALLPGEPYSITAAMEGFAPATAEVAVPSSPNATTTVRLRMERSINWVLLGIAAVAVGIAVAGTYWFFIHRGRRMHGRGRL
ncbi:MAG: PEGA domain-containing protein [Methanolinea sp.]|nr:PEGA domain-containing protein [Methanolinea sp.]